MKLHKLEVAVHPSAPPPKVRESRALQCRAQPKAEAPTARGEASGALQPDAPQPSAESEPNGGLGALPSSKGETLQPPLPSSEEPLSDSDSDSEIQNFFDSQNFDSEELEDLIARFIENYAAEANTEDPEVPDLPHEQMIHFSAFSEIAKYGFDLFSMFEEVQLDPFDQPLAAELKEKYSANFIYRFLVHFDISNFLKRQPYKLTSKEEISLFENRLALGEYYNTLRSYSNLDEDSGQSLFCGPKSYVNRIYNQQFKGTLKIVERLFSIHLDNDENIPKLPEWEIPELKESNRDSSILKFDQPLYKKSFLKKNPYYLEGGHSSEVGSSSEVQSSQQAADSSPFVQETTPFAFFCWMG